MLNNFPHLKRQKHDANINGNCLYCDQQQQHAGSCPVQSTTSQLASEYQHIRAAIEDPTIDMEDIERRLRKLETRLTLRIPDETTTNLLEQQQQLVDNVFYSSTPSTFNTPTATTTTTNNNNNNNNNSTVIPQQTSTMALTSTGIDINTTITEPHHFMKLLLNGINPAFVQQKAMETYGRRIDLVSPAMDNPNNQQGISNLAIDKEDPEELLWLDMVLTTRYPMCFIVYQMVEKNRLVEWVSHAYIDGLQGQVKLEYSLLAKSVRAFVYNHEKISARHDHGGDQDPHHRNINLNRGAFYFQQAEELLELCYMTSSRHTIRSLLHMYMYQVMTPGGHIKSVQYSDLAIRMAQALKLNNEKGMLVNEQLREDDRRLWWSTVWLHLWSCVSFNRPLLVDPSDIMSSNSRSPSKRQDESSQVGYCIDLCVNSVKLMLLSRSIRQRLLAEMTEAKLLWTLQGIEHQLETWCRALPEPLQLRFLTNEGTELDPMDDVGQHDGQSSQVFAMEIGLLLQGQWATAKIRVYECFGTNDASILDLLVVRHRLQVAVEFTNYLSQMVERIRPCFLMYLLTETQPCLTTLIALAAYEHNTDIIQMAAIRQLSMLKTLFQRYPCSSNSACHQWVQKIDQTLQERAPPPPQQQQQPTSMTSMDVNWSTSLLPILNESTPLSDYTYQHDHLRQYQHYQYTQHPYAQHQQQQQLQQQQYQPYLHQPSINQGHIYPMNLDLLSSTLSSVTTGESDQWRRTSMLNGFGGTDRSLSRESYDNKPSSPNPYFHQHGTAMQGMTLLSTQTSIVNHLEPSNSSSTTRIHVHPSSSSSSQLANEHNGRHQPSEKAAGKQSSWPSLDMYPDSSTLNHHQHSILHYPPTDPSR
ncbi:hypothetical protein BC941DRAFT_464123 [Chlamydoabsidia padenii]|nr:hypothetical protein BC941DRAFT_464123 [Chlamydoabsidia padenii]